MDEKMKEISDRLIEKYSNKLDDFSDPLLVKLFKEVVKECKKEGYDCELELFVSVQTAILCSQMANIIAYYYSKRMPGVHGLFLKTLEVCIKQFVKKWEEKDGTKHA